MRWIMALIGAVFLGISFGALGVFIGFFGGFALWSLVSSARSQHRPVASNSITVQKPSTPPPLSFREAHSSQEHGKLLWHAPAQMVKVRGIQIAGGMFYTCNGRASHLEPSAIDLSLSVAALTEDPAIDLGYYASYDGISPSQRRSYLEWMANGRMDADPSRRSLGYIFMFFYGIERRILVDGDCDPALLDEVARLLRTYGPAHKSRSLRAYALQLLHFGGCRLGAERYRQRWPSLLEFDDQRPDENGLRFVLANLFQLGERLDWTVAYRIALADPQSKRSAVVTRVREKFWALFEERYRNQFGDGILLKAGKQIDRVEYRPASSGLFSLLYEKKTAKLFEARLPNVYGLRSQFASLSEIWNSCVADLSGYSRVVSKTRDGLSASITQWQSLPYELRRASEHPLRSVIEELLGSAPTESGFPLVIVGTLASALGIAERVKLTPTQSRQIAETISSAGWQIAPSPMLSGLTLSWNQEVTLFPGTPSKNSGLSGAIRLLFLAIALASADGIIEQEEIEVFNNLIAPEIRNEDEWQYIRATEVALRREANVAVRSIPQIAKLIPNESRHSVLTAMAHIAAADGEVSLDEFNLLRRLAKSFGLGSGAVDGILRQHEAFAEVVIASGESSKARGEPIPSRPAAKKFQLDADRISALTEETREVISLLSTVMGDEDEPEPVVSNSQPERPGFQSEDRTPEWLSGIDLRYHQAVIELISHDELATQDFESLASRNHLLPDALYDAVNEWSDENFGDFLLERSEKIRVFRDLLPVAAASIP
jgi:uncharacterized tellurite resistance protein B-like protein